MMLAESYSLLYVLDMDENSVQIDLKGPLSYSDVISVDQARAIVVFLNTGSELPSTALVTGVSGAVPAAAAPTPKAAMSVRPTKVRASSVPEAFTAVAELPHSLMDIPPYGKLKTKQDKMLWGLEAAVQLGLKGLSGTDIEWITDQSGDGIQSKHIGVYYKSLNDKSLVNRVLADGTIRITDKGRDHLLALDAKETSA